MLRSGESLLCFPQPWWLGIIFVVSFFCDHTLEGWALSLLLSLGFCPPREALLLSPGFRPPREALLCCFVFFGAWFLSPQILDRIPTGLPPILLPDPHHCLF